MAFSGICQVQQIKLAAGTFIIMALFFHQQSYPSHWPLLPELLPAVAIGCPTRLTSRDAPSKCVGQGIVSRLSSLGSERRASSLISQVLPTRAVRTRARRASG